MKEKKKLHERTGLKVFAGFLAVIMFTVCFFSGVLTVICLQNNVFFDDGREFMENEMYDHAYRNARMFQSYMSRNEMRVVVSEDGSQSLVDKNGELVLPESPDGNFLIVLKDRDGNAVATTGQTASQHLYGYRQIIDTEPISVMSRHEGTNSAAHQEFSGVAEAFEVFSDDDFYVSSGVINAELFIEGKIADAFGGGSFTVSLGAIDPENGLQSGPALDVFGDAKFGDSFSAVDLGLVGRAQAESEQATAPAAAWPGSETVILAESGVPVNENDIKNVFFVRDIPLEGSSGNTEHLILDGLNNALIYDKQSYPLATESTMEKVDEILQKHPLDLENRAILLNTAESGFCSISGIYLDGTYVPTVFEDYYADVYADLTPEVVNGSSYVTLVSTMLISELCPFFPAAFILSALILIICAVFIVCSSGHHAGADGVMLIWFDKIPFEIFAVAILFCVNFLISAYSFFAYMHVFTKYYNQRILTIAACFGIVVGFGALLIITLFTLSARIKAKCFRKYTLIGFVCWVISRTIRLFVHLFTSLRQTWRTVILMLVVSALLELALIVTVKTREAELGVFAVIPVLTAFSVLMVLWSAGFESLRDYIRKIKNGELDNKIDRKFLFGNLKSTADDLEGVGEGVRLAVDERMRSERLKTELITNVSHDLKTPLTSIVNYIDILSKDDISDESAREHIEVLQRQAARMKKLIEDLVEVSKATSGNVPVNPERTDINLLLTQCAAEYAEKFSLSGLTPVLGIPEKKLVASLDGRLMWRILDNLLGNVCKYSLAGTRVYICAEDRGSDVLISFKNVSRCPLEVSGEDLMERFVRGDSSRNTEGSGLGLSIAKSLCDLQGVGFSIKIDGDLFKAELTVKKCDDSELFEDAAEDVVSEENVGELPQDYEAEEDMVPEPAANSEYEPAGDE